MDEIRFPDIPEIGYINYIIWRFEIMYPGTKIRWCSDD